MSGRPDVGVMVRGEWPPEALPETAAEIEGLGYDELWVVEDFFYTAGPTSAALALAHTAAIHVGIGLLPAAVRNPAVTAMEIAGLARIHPGRLSVAFGHGVEAWMRQIGARPADRMAMLRETLGAVRALFAGRTVSTAGRYVNLEDVALDHPPARPPRLLVGTTGPRGLELAARLGDGVVLPQGATSEAIRWARGITTAHEPASRTVVYAWFHIGEDRDALRAEVERWLALGRYPQLIRRSPLAGGGPVSDEALDAVAIAGDPASCAAAVRRLGDAGADSIVLRPAAVDGMTQVRRFAAEVLPALREG